MKFRQYYVSGSNGKSNCVIRSFCKLFNEEYDNVFEELCVIAKELNLESFNEIEVFETYMEKRGILPIEYGKDIKIKELELDKESCIVFCWDKKDYYHMVPIIKNVLYDKDDKSLDLYVIKLYKKK